MADSQNRLTLRVKALSLGFLAGFASLAAVRYVLLPAVGRSLTQSQIQWLRWAFHAHPVWFLLGIAALAGVLALPVLLVALWVLRAGRKRAPAGNPDA